jgi:hypothetical protein
VLAVVSAYPAGMKAEGRTNPTPTAEMKVPRKANVRMEPKFLKKLA